jgi:hypothetical protein
MDRLKRPYLFSLSSLNPIRKMLFIPGGGVSRIVESWHLCGGVFRVGWGRAIIVIFNNLNNNVIRGCLKSNSWQPPKS